MPLCALKGRQPDPCPIPKAGIAPDISGHRLRAQNRLCPLGQQLRIAAMVDIGYDGDELREKPHSGAEKHVARSFPELEGLDEAEV